MENFKTLWFRAVTALPVLAMGACASANVLPANTARLYEQMKSANDCPASDTTCRRLSKGEKALARSVFGNKLPLDDIRVRLRPGRTPFMQTAGYVDNWDIIVLMPEVYTSDFSREPRLRKWFMHELTHMDQKLSGKNMAAATIGTMLAHGFNYGAAYQYVLEPGKPYEAYNVEQQAELVGDLVNMRDVLSGLDTASYASAGGTRLRHALYNQRVCQLEETLAPMLAGPRSCKGGVAPGFSK